MDMTLTPERRSALNGLIAHWMSQQDVDGSVVERFDYYDVEKIDELIDEAIAPTISDAVVCATAALARSDAVQAPTAFLHKLKGYLMRVRISGDDTLAAYRRACTETECEIEEWLKENSAAPVAPAAAAALHTLDSSTTVIPVTPDELDSLRTQPDDRAALDELTIRVAKELADYEMTQADVDMLLPRWRKLADAILDYARATFPHPSAATNSAGKASQAIEGYDLKTSAGGRGYLVEYFATRLRRHDFQRFIEERLAADFACVLAQHLQKRDAA